MGRSSASNFKYQPVNFEDDDDDDELARELGPSLGSRRSSCARTLRGICILSMVLATAAAIAAVVLYSTMVTPPGRRDYVETFKAR